MEEKSFQRMFYWQVIQSELCSGLSDGTCVLNHCTTLPRAEGQRVQVRRTGTRYYTMDRECSVHVQLQGGGSSSVGAKGLYLQASTVWISATLGGEGLVTMVTRSEESTYDCGRSSEHVDI